MEQTLSSMKMKKAKFVVCLTTNDNDYQIAQSNSAEEAAQRLGIEVEIMHAENDAVNQSQQLLKIIQSKPELRPDGIVTEPVGTGMSHVAFSAAEAGLGWVVLNREVEYIPQIRRKFHVPIFSVTTDQKEVGRLQGRQFAEVLPRGGTILYIQGLSIGGAAHLRTEGMLETKPDNIKLIVLRGQWSERSGFQAVTSWLQLSTSGNAQIGAVAAQNDAMAVGAKKAFQSHITGLDREKWLSVPYLGCDGLPNTGQAWVKSGLLNATIAIPPNTGMGLEMLAAAIKNGSQPPEITFTEIHSVPSLDMLRGKYGAPAAIVRA